MPHGRPLSVFLEAGVVPRDSREDNHNQLGDDLSRYLVVRPGDIVFNKLRSWQGGIGVSSFEGIVSPAYYVCRPQSALEPRFLHYLLRSKPYLTEITRISKWMPPSQFDTPWDVLRLLPILSPPVEEQRRIADFLGAEISRIDELVTKKRQLVSLLEERVDHAISIRIAESPLVHPNSNKPSIPISRALRKLDRMPRSEDVVTAFRDGQVTARSLRRTEGYTESWTDGARVQGVARGDVVVHGLDGFAGAIGAAEADGVCSPVYHVCTPRDSGDADYLGRLLRILAISGYLELFATSTRERAVDFRNWRRFGRIPIPDVDLSEQREIGNRIRKIKPLEAAVERSAELAAERRQTLITAAVAGQLDVTTARSGVRV